MSAIAHSPSVQTTESLWRRFREQNCPDARDAIIGRYRATVNIIARRLLPKGRSDIELDDLEQAGLLGLVAAVDRFDPAYGVDLVTYAKHWIESEIKRQIRACGPDRMGLSPASFLELLAAVAAPVMAGSVDEIPDTSPLLATFATAREPGNPEYEALAAEVRGRLAWATSKLPARERGIVARYYVDGATLAEIAVSLGCSERRAAQLHHQALTRLSGFLLADRELLGVDAGPRGEASGGNDPSGNAGNSSCIGRDVSRRRTPERPPVALSPRLPVRPAPAPLPPARDAQGAGLGAR